MMDNFDIIATINTKVIKKNMLLWFLDNGVTIFRINSAFIEAGSLKGIIRNLRNIAGNSIKILIDLPGYKIRFLYLDKTISFRPNIPFELRRNYFNYQDFFDVINAGSTLRTNNGFNVLVVKEKRQDSILCISNISGMITKGRGIHLSDLNYRPSENIVSSYDLKLLRLIKECDVDYAGLSYIHNMSDVNLIKNELRDSKIKCIPKIESKESVNNLVDIARNSQLLILDRGDLAGEIGLDLIWKTQKEIVSICKKFNCKIIIATQVLASMVKNPLPTIAEIDSLYGLLNIGIDGIQLSEETSVGRNAKKCIEFISEAVNRAGRRNNVAKQGFVIWIMGLTASGKTSIAKRLADKLIEKNMPVNHYDGDEVRESFGPSFGFDEKNRFQVVDRLVTLSNQAISQGKNVIVSAVTAHENAQRHVFQNIKCLITIFLKCSVEECARRDYKGLYKKAKNGEINTLIGFNTTYNIPKKVDLVIDTETKSVEESCEDIMKLIPVDLRISKSE